MYLSRVELDPRQRAVQAALVRPSVLHGLIETSLGLPQKADGARPRSLWRADTWAGRLYLLFLSENEPDFAPFVLQLGAAQGESRSYDSLLGRLEAGQRWRFRLCANPVRSVFVPGARGKVAAHVTAAQQRQWMLQKAPGNGFALEEDGFEVVRSEWKKFQRSKDLVTLRQAEYEGVLTVTDAEAFRLALLCGVGREKAYGCGLLTITNCGVD
jgi:CRISPR system Cascade subunit CasE